MKMGRWACLALGLFLAGCLFNDDKQTLIGAWVRNEGGFLSFAPATVRTYEFDKSGTVRYESGFVDWVLYRFSGTWEMRGDSLLIHRVSCSRPDSTGAFAAEDCSGPPHESDRVYWDGERIYGLNSSNAMRQYFDKK
jgi:hypothetical protein